MKYFKYILFSMMLSLPMITMAVDDTVNINKANALELTTLLNMDRETAEAVVEYRKENGPFKTKEALLAVEDIGRDFLNINKDNIVLKSEGNS